MQKTLDSIYLDTEDEMDTLREWEYIQGKLLASTFTAAYPQSLSWRQVISAQVTEYTQGRIRLYWEPLDLGNSQECDRFCEIRFKQIRYGFLGLTRGYLVSRYFPEIPQQIAHICALLLAFAEYQELVQHQLDALSPLYTTDTIDGLTRRERDVLLGLIRGERNNEIALSLGIEPTTVHTHRKRLYRRLGVHSAQEATLRCFTHRLMDWLDRPRHREIPHSARISEMEGRTRRKL